MERGSRSGGALDRPGHRCRPGDRPGDCTVARGGLVQGHAGRYRGRAARESDGRACGHEGSTSSASAWKSRASRDWASAMAVAELAKWGGLDLLVNCAGISPRGTVESTSEALWERTLSINLKGPWLGIKAALPLLRQRGEGRSSTSARPGRRGRCRGSFPTS